MDLSSEESTFAYHWLKKHVDEQPLDDESLTWFVSAAKLYTDYASACYVGRCRPLSFTELWVALQIMFPYVSTGKIKNNGIYQGIRYYTDHIGGNLKHGV